MNFYSYLRGIMQRPTPIPKRKERDRLFNRPGGVGGGRALGPEPPVNNKYTTLF